MVEKNRGRQERNIRLQQDDYKEKKEGKSVVGQILVVLLLIVLIPIIVLNSILIVRSYTDTDHIPAILGMSPLVVLSGSMSGTFETNALIVIQDVDAENLEVGDVICYLIEGTAVTHRITQVTEDEEGTLAYVTQGDANDSEDNYYVYADAIEGQYIGHIAELGAFVLFMQTPAGMGIFIALPIVLYLVLDFMLSRKDKKSDDERTKELEKELEALKKQMKN